VGEKKENRAGHVSGHL